MPNPRLMLQTPRSAILLAVCLVPCIVTSEPLAVDKPATQASPQLVSLLNSLYYSTAKTGLNSFDCSVHLRFEKLRNGANQIVTFSEDDARVAVLKRIKITLHVRLTGRSTVDWDQSSAESSPLDKVSVAILDAAHKYTEPAMDGFLKTWVPMVNGSFNNPSVGWTFIPKKQGKGFRLYYQEDNKSVLEDFDGSAVLQQYDAELPGIRVKVFPTFKPTDKGLLVNHLVSHLMLGAGGPPGVKPDDIETHTSIDYQTIDGFPVPAKLTVELVGNGVLSFTFDGCRVNPPTT